MEFLQEASQQYSGKSTSSIDGERRESEPSANFVHPTVFGNVSALSVNSLNNTWISDIGASDHMTSKSNQITKLLPLS